MRVRLHLALLAGFTGLYGVLTVLLAMRRRLWFDEIFTLHVARPADLWGSLLASRDPNPPLAYAAIRGATALIGEGPLALRVPAMIGVWVFVVCLFVLAARRGGMAFGWLALLFPLTTGVFPYATEGRPYGLLLGFAGLALVAWQAAAEGRGRPWSVLGLLLALAAALSTHFYAVLLWVPLLAGEAVRTLDRRRVDVPLLAALGLAPAVLVAYRPLIAQARTMGASFWARPDLFLVARFYGFLLENAAPALAALAVCGLLAAALLPSRGPRPTQPTIPPYEIVAAAGLILLPVAGVVLGRLATGAFTERYALPTVAGLAVPLAVAAARASGGRPAVAAALSLALLGGFVVNAARQLKWATTIDAKERRLAAELDRHASPDTPIVVTDPVLYLQMVHYAPRPLAARLAYALSGPPNTAEQNLLTLRAWVPLRVEPIEALRRAHPRLDLYRRNDNDALPAFPNELIPKLSAEGVPMRVVWWTSDAFVLRAGDPVGGVVNGRWGSGQWSVVSE